MPPPASTSPSPPLPRFAIGQVRINATDLAGATAALDGFVQRGQSGYVCVTNVRTAHLSNKDAAYGAIQNSSLMTVPDGMPLVWYARRTAFPQVGRVCGPDLMESLFTVSGDKGYTHYFYGSNQSTLTAFAEKLQRRFSGLVVKGLVAPPFQPLEAFDIDALAQEMNQLKPTFFWVGLGAPKQERLMALLQPKLTHTISIGVGLAFDYFAGNVARPPNWIQRSGLEWAWRLSFQPAKIGRFSKPFFWFLALYLKSYLQQNESGKSRSLV